MTEMLTQAANDKHFLLILSVRYPLDTALMLRNFLAKLLLVAKNFASTFLCFYLSNMFILLKVIMLMIIVLLLCFWWSSFCDCQ